jgi:predicted TIM-barrel fold metal-dependent hydrolase
MDECGVELIVNITMRVGREALDMIFKYHAAAPCRFATYGWMDWSDLKSPGFFLGTVDRSEDLVEHGACGLKLWKDLGTSLSDADGKLLRVDDERLAPLFEKAAELGVPIMFHTSDPDAFFLPIDPENERYEEFSRTSRMELPRFTF